MLFIRSPKVEETFWQICNKSGQISVKEYNFVLYYTIARIVFSNGARAEYGYKAEKAHIQSYSEEYENFKLLKLPFAKVGLTVAVMSMNDFRYYESYQNLRKKVAEQNQKPDDDKFAFVTYSMTKLGHQISENIKDVMVNFEKITYTKFISNYNLYKSQTQAGFKPYTVYDVRRASTTSAVAKIWEQFKKIEQGEVDIGQAARGHSAKTAANIYDK